MDRQGFEKINQTLEDSPLGKMEITPEPEEGEDVPFITIRPLDRTRPADILNVLASAGLIEGHLEHLGADGDPLLKPITNDAFAITLEDKNCR